MLSAVFAEHLQNVRLLASLALYQYFVGCLCWVLIESNGCLGIGSGYGYHDGYDLMDSTTSCTTNDSACGPDWLSVQ